MRVSFATMLAAMILLIAASAGTAADETPGTVSGTVSSVDGARLPRATVTLVDRASRRQLTATSDNLGAFMLERVPAGTYTLVAEFPGFAAATRADVEVRADAAVDLKVTLEPAHVAETVTVAGALPRDSVEVTDVRESPARDVGELLGESTGLWKLRKGAIANDVVLRGLQSRDLNVLIDGERVYGACPNHMDPPAFHVDFSEVERVDVGKGPFDVRYQGSLGGIVNIVTRRPELGWTGSAAIALGSNGAVNPSLTASYGSRRFSWLGGGSYRRADPYTDGRGRRMTYASGYRPDAIDSDAFRAATAWTRTAWLVSEGHQIGASYTRQETDHVLYPYLLMDAIWDNADRVVVDYTASGRGSRVSALKARASWSRVDHWMTDAYRLSSATAQRAYSMGTDASTALASGRVEAAMGSTTAGAEVYRRNWNTETMMGGMGYEPQFSIPDVNVDSLGLFAEHARALGSRFSLDVGARVDRLDSRADPRKADVVLYAAYHGSASTARRDVVPSGRAKLTYQPTPTIEIAAAMGHTGRVPEANERFFALRRMGTDWVGNPGLDPAHNTGVDLSMSLHRPRVTLTASAYTNTIRDYVAVYAVRRQIAGAGVMNTAARSYANVDARLRGIEANGSVSVRSAFTISGDLAAVRGTITPRPERGLTSRDLAETPPLRARLRARIDNARLFVELEGIASARQSRVDRTLGEAATPPYAIANATTGLRRGALSITAGVANLFNAYYVEHLSFQRDPYRSGVRLAEPGRNVFTNLSWRF